MKKLEIEKQFDVDPDQSGIFWFGFCIMIMILASVIIGFFIIMGYVEGVL